MHISDFDYELPPELIAGTPVEPRDASRMMVLKGRTGDISDARFRNLPDFLEPSAVLVLNDTRVIRARTHARLERRGGTSREIEIFFAEPGPANTWQVLCRPGRRIRPGDRAVFGSGELSGAFRETMGADLHILEMESAEEVLKRFGQMPLPPYLGRPPGPDDEARYQTVFSRNEGAVAAPTAGLHFTDEVLNDLRKRGVAVVTITLHVGIGTFLPVRTDNPEEHVLRPERYQVPPETATVLTDALASGRRIVAAGTTTTRTLEFLMRRYGGIVSGAGSTDLFILPGFEFRIVKTLLTNFHLPQSTLLMLVSAFSGRENILAAYRHAIRQRYRFYSYGDCMLLNHD